MKEWTLRYEGLDADQEGLREALCTVGNGVFATRGAFEEERAGPIHYPGTYLAGGYNEAVSEVAGRPVVNEDLVNLPNWLWLSVETASGWLSLWDVEVLSYHQELDLREGVFRRSFRFRDQGGRILGVESLRLVHMKHPRLAALKWRISCEEASGELRLISGLDGAVTNDNVERYRQLEGDHLEIVNRGAAAPRGLFLKARARRARWEVAMAARTTVMVDGEERPGRRWIVDEEEDRIAEELVFEVKSGQTVEVEKVVAVVSDRERGMKECGQTARVTMEEAGGFEELLRSHRKAWQRLWRRCDLRVSVKDPEAGREDQLALRAHIFHLLQTASPNTVNRDVGIPARGLHGEAYRGHIFWDELFILPFYLQRLPSVVRSTILYRYHRLEAARALARQIGCRGATFPWQSASDGSETTQELHLNPMSGRWDPDHSHLQRHINGAVLYNTWGYYQATGDRAFMEEYGAELMLEICLFWSSLTDLDEDAEVAEIHGVMGPDEYHEKLPGAERGGLPNNVYTNLLAVYCLLKGLEVVEILSPFRREELLDELMIDARELDRWERITRCIKVVEHDGVISQFEGYEELEELDWEAYQEEHDSAERLDRILKAEGDTPDRYKVSKQADVIMLLYLFRREELRELFGRLGHRFDDEVLHRNVEYYRARTSHGSTLSRVVFASAVHRDDPDEGYELFREALKSDLGDIQGGTTREGVHLGAMAGTVDVVTRHWAGMYLKEGRLCFCPCLPEGVQSVGYVVQHRWRWLEVNVTPEVMEIAVDQVVDEAVEVEVEGERYRLAPGTMVRIWRGEKRDGASRGDAPSGRSGRLLH